MGNIIITKFIRGDSIIPVSNDLKRNIVPSWVKEIILVNIFPTNPNPADIKGTFNIKNARVLDLYSGTGSFGLECLSREASHVTFVENNKSAQKILLKNIDKVKVYKKILIIKNSVFSYLTRIENFNYKFDLVFLKTLK